MIDPNDLGKGFKQVGLDTLDEYVVSVRRKNEEVLKPEVFPNKNNI